MSCRSCEVLEEPVEAPGREADGVDADVEAPRRPLGRFRAHDHETGEVLWEVKLGSPVTGFPISYAVDGRQHVAVSTGVAGTSGKPAAPDAGAAPEPGEQSLRVCPALTLVLVRDCPHPSETCGLMGVVHDWAPSLGSEPVQGDAPQSGT